LAGKVKEACHGRNLLQAMRLHGLYEKWNCARLPAVSLPFMWLQFYDDGAARRGKPPEMKALAVLLYAMGGMSFRAIARILGVSNVAILNWVCDEARQIPEPSTKVEQVVVTLDEMWHFIKKKLANCGFGEPMTLLIGEPSPGFLVAVMTPLAKSSSTKSASKAKPS
jgi:hypothetical protein